MSSGIQNKHNNAGTKKYLCFSLGGESYAVPLLAVREVIAVPEITPVPHTPSHFLGIMNLRGQVISIIDLRTKFGLKAELTSRSAVIVCDLSPISLGIVVNSINAVLSISDQDIQPKPDIASNKNTAYITGVSKQGERLVLLLDLAKALDVEDLVAAREAQQAPQAKTA
ncbi:MAG: purine-binding chemotaxis protein CheW [Deltaproteobacteria bacterium]|nr:purine-binding chemotaxis protein CheW [Deltaproteobacteria bacterium]